MMMMMMMTVLCMLATYNEHVHVIVITILGFARQEADTALKTKKNKISECSDQYKYFCLLHFLVRMRDYLQCSCVMSNTF